MASVKFNKKVFEKEIGKLTDEMQNKIALFGTTVESLTENEIELDITPDRPDLLSYYGFRRAFLGFLGRKIGMREYKLNKPAKGYEVKVDATVKDVRPHIACAIVKGVKFDDEKIKDIIELQEKLHSTIGRRRKKLAIGVYPLDKVKLPISYKAMEPDKIKFVPLEMNKEMSGLEILQRHPAGQEYSQLLAGKAKFPVFMDADKNVLSMPPIINSELTGRVTTKTKNVFVECSGFDVEILNKCLNIVVSTLAEMGGKIYRMKVKGKMSPNFDFDKRNLSVENTNKLLGLKLKEKEVKLLIEKMGHNYKSGVVEIPSWRVDILHEVDLIEDVAIAYGYDKFVPEIPEISSIGKEDSREIIKKKIAEVLVGLGLLEISNYHLTKKNDQLINMGISEKQDRNFIEVEESKTEYNILRRDLTHYALKIISENVDSVYPQRIFEMGTIFNLDGKEIDEFERLCVASTPGNFTDVRQILDYLGKMVGVEFEVKEYLEKKPHFIEGRVGEILLKGKQVGLIGEVHPRILKNWKIKMPVSLFEIDLEKVFLEFI
ncbi:phenylalanine--tRNA ligase subunit beta [archaeon]|jgi:phenylalanyl-tRNA synthetase beta chain|nr:phenylalanine--tRNA ligase subunit beta [archaeon]